MSLRVAAFAFCACVLGSAVDAGIESANTTPPRVASTDDILNIARTHMVAILVERTEDVQLEARGGRRGARSTGAEERIYFERPEGFVSGILLDAEGHVLTTHYNVAGKIKSIQVKSVLGVTYSARHLSSSLPDDLALLKLEPANGQLPTPAAVPWGKSSDLLSGQMVFVTGLSPEPESVTVTRGIISATERNAGRALQTDAELNYGNVGGPIFNLNGEVVGIASFVGHTHPQWGVNSGIGFGTKAKTIHTVLPALKEGNEVRWAFLGVGPTEPDPEGPGFRIELVLPGSAADKAGLQRGDFVLEFDGVPLDDFGDLRSTIYRYVAHDKVTLQIRRKDETFSVVLVLGERVSE